MGEIELPDDLLAALRAIAGARGVEVSEVLAEWLREKGFGSS